MDTPQKHHAKSKERLTEDGAPHDSTCMYAPNGPATQNEGYQRWPMARRAQTGSEADCADGCTTL